MTVLDLIRDKTDLHKAFTDMKCDYLGVVCKDVTGKEIGIYLWEHEFENGDVFLLEDYLGELRLYATDDESVFKDYDLMFDRLDDYFYEFDSYPTYCDWVKFPITDVKFFPMDDSDQMYKLAKYYKDKGQYTIIHPNKKDGLDILVYHEDIKIIHEEFSDIKRIKNLIERGCLVYETFKDDKGNIIYLKEVNL